MQDQKISQVSSECCESAQEPSHAPSIQSDFQDRADPVRYQAIGWMAICGFFFFCSLTQTFLSSQDRAANGPKDHGPMQILLNQSSVVEVELLPGVGPKLAERIVEFRDERGGIEDWVELSEVPGIGPKTLERLKPWLILDES